MATQKAWLTGKEAVCGWYADMAREESPCYSVWEGKQLLFSYSGDDIDRGMVRLDTNLSLAADSKVSCVYTLRLYNDIKEGKNLINEKTPYCASINFRCVPVEQDDLARYKLEGIGYIESRLKALESKKDEEPEGWAGMLNGVMQSPQGIQFLTQAAVGLVNKFLPGVFGPVPALAGPTMGQIPANAGDRTIEWAMEVLLQADPDIEQDLCRLADVALKNPQMFKMLIQNLRTL
jgi:hypothetical protein